MPFRTGSTYDIVDSGLSLMFKYQALLLAILLLAVRA
jgi:hypothetical protein